MTNAERIIVRNSTSNTAIVEIYHRNMNLPRMKLPKGIFVL